MHVFTNTSVYNIKWDSKINLWIRSHTSHVGKVFIIQK